MSINVTEILCFLVEYLIILSIIESGYWSLQQLLITCIFALFLKGIGASGWGTMNNSVLCNINTFDIDSKKGL